MVQIRKNFDYNFIIKNIKKTIHLNTKMKSLVSAGLLALVMVHDISSVRAITLKTLLENQVSA